MPLCHDSSTRQMRLPRTVPRHSPPDNTAAATSRMKPAHLYLYIQASSRLRPIAGKIPLPSGENNAGSEEKFIQKFCLYIQNFCFYFMRRATRVHARHQDGFPRKTGNRSTGTSRRGHRAARMAMSGVAGAFDVFGNIFPWKICITENNHYLCRIKTYTR